MANFVQNGVQLFGKRGGGLLERGKAERERGRGLDDRAVRKGQGVFVEKLKKLSLDFDAGLGRGNRLFPTREKGDHDTRFAVRGEGPVGRTRERNFFIRDPGRDFREGNSDRRIF